MRSKFVDPRFDMELSSRRKPYWIYLGNPRILFLVVKDKRNGGINRTAAPRLSN